MITGNSISACQEPKLACRFDWNSPKSLQYSESVVLSGAGISLDDGVHQTPPLLPLKCRQTLLDNRPSKNLSVFELSRAVYSVPARFLDLTSEPT